jgi:hypothetical protein
MKNVLLLVTLAVGTAAFGQANSAQTPQTSPTVLPSNIVQKGVASSYSDTYCAGWMSPTDVSNNNFVLSGEQSPNTSRFFKNDSIIVNGSGWQVGQKLSIVRRAKDPNYYTLYAGQAEQVKQMGLMFFDMGQATVTFIQGNNAVAHIDFSCDATVPGDLIIPFQERQSATFRARPYDFKHFVALKGATKGRVVLSKDFDAYIGEGKKFYVNLGANQGLKVGDYLLIYRGYKSDDFDPSDHASFNSMSYEDDQLNEPKITRERLGEVPNRSLGEAVILYTTPTTATAMIVYSIEDVHIGDHFEVLPPESAEGNGGEN